MPTPPRPLRKLSEFQDEPDGPRPPGPRFYRRGWFWLLVVVVVAAGVVFALVHKVSDDATPVRHTVTYRVSGDAPADISFYSGDGTGIPRSSQLAGQRLPWTHDIVITGGYDGFTLTATFHDLSHRGRLACTITVDGKQVATDAATGTAFVGCDGTGYRSR